MSSRASGPASSALLVGSGWLLLMALALFFLQRDALPYLEYSPEAYGSHWGLRFWLIPHILGAGPALLAGPLQFSTRLRQRWPAVHRAVGRVYVLGGLVAAPAALRLALGSECELCAPPLAILATLWLATTVVALLAARRRSFAAHRQFMIRSYVLMCAFVVIRLRDFLPLPSFSADPEANRSVYEWLCWVLPLLVTEIFLSWGPSLRGRRGGPSNPEVQMARPGAA